MLASLPPWSRSPGYLTWRSWVKKNPPHNIWAAAVHFFYLFAQHKHELFITQWEIHSRCGSQRNSRKHTLSAPIHMYASYVSETTGKDDRDSNARRCVSKAKTPLLTCSLRLSSVDLSKCFWARLCVEGLNCVLLSHYMWRFNRPPLC